MKKTNKTNKTNKTKTTIKEKKSIDVMSLLWEYVINEKNLEKAFEYLRDLILRQKPENVKTTKSKDALGKSLSVSSFVSNDKIVEIHYDDQKIIVIFVIFPD